MSQASSPTGLAVAALATTVLLGTTSLASAPRTTDSTVGITPIAAVGAEPAAGQTGPLGLGGAAAALFTDTNTVPVNPAYESETETVLLPGDPAASADPGTNPPAGTVDCRTAKCVALTFDDGPGPGTEKILNVLDEYQVPATFYVLGDRVKQYPEVVQRINDTGHELGNHSTAHENLLTLSDGAVSETLDTTDMRLQKTTNAKPGTVRPPYGNRDDRVDGLIDRPIVLWDVDTMDWEHRNPVKVLQNVQEKTTSGSIILTHDIQPATVAATEGIVKWLLAEGYTLVTVSDLMASVDMQPGTVYTRLPMPDAEATGDGATGEQATGADQTSDDTAAGADNPNDPNAITGRLQSTVGRWWRTVTPR